MKEFGDNKRQVGGRSGAGRATSSSPRGGRRERAGGRGAKSKGLALRRITVWLPGIGKALFVVCALVLLVVGYRAVASASFFRAEAIDVTGVHRASAEHIAATVKRKVTGTNVWQLDLDNLSRELEGEPWVRSAVVSRVLPDGLRVRVTEREPRVVVRTGKGQLMWVDEDAVLLARVAPTDDLPPFFLRGYDETLTTSAQTENRRRIAEAMKMIGEWRRAGVAERISEVNVEDLRDVRAQLAGRDAEIEVRLGASNYDARLMKALEVLDAERDAPGGRQGARIVRLDATTERRVIIGVGNAPQAAIPSVENLPPATIAARAPERPRASNTATQIKRDAPSVAAISRTGNVKKGERRDAPEKDRKIADATRDARKPRGSAPATAPPRASVSAERPRRAG